MVRSDRRVSVGMVRPVEGGLRQSALPPARAAGGSSGPLDAGNYFSPGPGALLQHLGFRTGRVDAISQDCGSGEPLLRKGDLLAHLCEARRRFQGPETCLPGFGVESRRLVGSGRETSNSSSATLLRLRVSSQGTKMKPA